MFPKKPLNLETCIHKVLYASSPNWFNLETGFQHVIHTGFQNVFDFESGFQNLFNAVLHPMSGKVVYLSIQCAICLELPSE